MTNATIEPAIDRLQRAVEQAETALDSLESRTSEGDGALRAAVVAAIAELDELLGRTHG